MRKPVIAGNWKMFKTVGDSVATALALKPLVANANHCEVVIAPVFTALKSVADRLEGSNIRIAAQNCATESNCRSRISRRSISLRSADRLTTRRQSQCCAKSSKIRDRENSTTTA